MAYTRKTVDLSIEKNIITGMIVHDQFLKDITVILKDLSYIKSPYLRLIASWVVDYHKTNDTAPKKLIQDIFIHHRNDIDDEYAENIEKVLSHLNTSFIEGGEHFNYDYHYKKAEEYIKSQSLLVLAADINALVAENNINEAEKMVGEYKRIERPAGSGIDVLSDINLIRRMFSEEEQTLFTIPGAFGEAIKDVYRGDVIAIGGASKRGKSWYMWELAKYALLHGLKIAYFTLEMKDIIMARRIYQSFTGQTKHPMLDGIQIPYFTEEGLIEYKFVPKTGMEYTQTVRVQRKLKKQVRQGQLRLYDGSSGGTTVAQICSTLDRDALYDDFIPDVVAIDYADIIEPEYRRGDARIQNTEIWKDIKRDIAQKRNNLVITASQLDRQSINNDGDVSNIAENIRKFDQMSHFIVLNQSKAEKKAQLMRVSVSGRHDEFEVMDEVVCLQCLGIGRPIMGSKWKRDIPNYKEIVDGAS